MSKGLVQSPRKTPVLTNGEADIVPVQRSSTDLASGKPSACQTLPGCENSLNNSFVVMLSNACTRVMAGCTLVMWKSVMAWKQKQGGYLRGFNLLTHATQRLVEQRRHPLYQPRTRCSRPSQKYRPPCCPGNGCVLAHLAWQL